MAKAIEQTPVLEGKDAIRLLEILTNIDKIELTKKEKEVHTMMKSLPDRLKI